MDDGEDPTEDSMAGSEERKILGEKKVHPDLKMFPLRFRVITRCFGLNRKKHGAVQCKIPLCSAKYAKY